MRPNVLFVTVDSLRADHVSAIADSPVETPGIDGVAHEGTTYTDAFAQGPFTTFSMPSLFTSRYPSGLRYVEFSDSVVGVYPSGETTLTETLAASGYDTAGFHSNPLLSSLFDFNRGFDVFDADLPFASLSLPGRLKLLTNKLRRLLRTHAYVTAETITDRAADWADAHDSSNPFFLWTHYMDVHGPYQRKEGFVYANKYRGEKLWQKAVHSPEEITEDEHTELLETYREEVAYTDAEIGRLVERVDAAAERPTLVVITADHGDGFDEHGYYSHPHQAHDVLLNVPLVIRDPTDTVAGGTVDTPTELTDIAPTILDAVGDTVPDSFEGTTLGTEGEGDPLAIGEAELTPGYRAAFVTPERKYVVNDITEESRLYDRTGDRPEGTELPSDRDDVADFKQIEQAHREREAAVEVSATAQDIEDEDVRDRLEKLGYLE